MKKNNPFYAIKSFKIVNFKGIKFLEMEDLPKNAPWIFLTGENGYGKTSVLQALAVALYGEEPHTFQYTKENSGVTTEIKIFCNQSGKIFPDAQQAKEKKKFECIACYGSSRLDTFSESSYKHKKSPTLSIFDSTTLLENIELQLSRWHFKTTDSEFKTKYETVISLIKKLLDLKSIKIDKKTDEVLYIEKDREGKGYEPLLSKQLASGYRSIICMIGDMILRLFETLPRTYDPSDLEGIVIIDELDLHFHPNWQKRLPGLLSNVFPRIQFIASTHNPIPLLGAPKNSVFLKVNRNESEGITIERLEQIEKQLPDLLPNTMLTSPVFGFQEIFAATHSINKRVRTENSYDEIILSDTLDERLEKFKNSKLEKQLKNMFKSK